MNFELSLLNSNLLLKQAVSEVLSCNDITEKYDHVSFDSQTYELKVKIPMTPGSINRPYTRNDIIKSMSLFDKRFSRTSISG